VSSILLALALLALFAAPAQAGLSTWTSLAGLSELSGASWVRVYASGSPPTTIYAGTEGDGVFRSLNDGLSWEPFSSGLAGEGMSIRAIFTSGGKVYAGTDGGLFANGGSGWEPIAQGPEEDPQHPKKLNAAVQAVISLPGGTMLAGTASFGVFKSADDGQTWTPPPEGNGMPNDGQTVWSFASFANFVWAATSSGIYRSADFGSTWTLSSDGIPESATTLAVFPDSKVPTIYYAATASDGLYRTINGGVTWEPIDPEHFNGGIIRAVQEFSGDQQTRLYTATQEGLWVATVPNVTVPGPVGSVQVPGPMSWRQASEAGLGSNTIMWALSNFTTTPGTLLAGTQSNGGYALTFQPPVNTEAPKWFPVPLKVGTGLLGLPGAWSGTPEIEYAYQWQRCSTTSSGSCSDIEGASDRVYSLTGADENKYLRLAVTATNDFPEPIKTLHVAYSTIGGPVEHAPGPLPGEVQRQAPTILDVSPGAEQSLPTEGDTLSAPPGAPGESGWYFNPAAEAVSISYHWLRCDEEGENCARIPGAKSQTYVPTPEDDGLALRVEVSGNDAFGTATLPISGATNPIIPLAATNTSPPTLTGHPYVGSTLVGGVGAWHSPATFYERRWEQCQADGSGCSQIQGETSPGYTVRPEDYGMRLRMNVIADVNPSDRLPLAVEVQTPLSEVISYPPGVTPPATPVIPISSGIAPVLQLPVVSPALLALSLGSAKVKSGRPLTLRFSLSSPGSLSIAIARLSTGHRRGRACAASTHKRHGAKCTLAKNIGTISTRQISGAGTVAIATKIRGHKLAPGSYRATITPIGPGGQRGATKVVTFTVTRR
jgi:hypothetical protein